MTTIRITVEPPAGKSSEHQFHEGAVTFGRAAGCDMVIGDQSMSRQHARIIMEGDTWYVEDLGARNGTFVNGARISARQALAPGDVIKMGGTRVRVGGGSGPARPTTLGAADLATSIFRPAAEISNEVERSDTAPARVAARLKAINDFHRGIAGPVSLDELLALLLERLFETLNPEEGVILLRQVDGSLRTAASRRLKGATGDLLVSRRLVDEVVEKGSAALVSDIAVDERFAHAQSIIGSGIRSILAAPISDPTGTLGMIAIYSRASVRRFSEDDLELLVSLASAAALRIRNVALAEEAAARRVHDHELALAHEIQMAMLPRHSIERPEIEIGAAMVPARAVGGDLYDFFVVGDRLWFIVADAAGKGVSAALFMAMTRTLFRAVAQSETAVAAVAARMNAELARDNERQFFVTALVGSLDLASGDLRFANAGHLPPLVAAASGASYTPPPDSDIALGILEGAAYREHRIALVPGHVLLVLTDGVIDAVNPKGELFSESRLRKSFSETVEGHAQQIVTALVDSVNAFAAAAPQEDDITVLALRYIGRSAR